MVLMAVLNDRIALENWRNYVADMICLNVRPKYEGEIEFYSKIMQDKPKDELTAKQIIDGILKKLN